MINLKKMVGCLKMDVGIVTAGGVDDATDGKNWRRFWTLQQSMRGSNGTLILLRIMLKTPYPINLRMYMGITIPLEMKLENFHRYGDWISAFRNKKGI